MIFITQELYKEWKKRNKDIFNEIRNINKRSNSIFPEDADTLTDYDILNIMLELEMKDFLLDVKNSYYFDAEGFIFEATNRLLNFHNLLEKKRKSRPSNNLPFLFTDRELIPIVVTALYDITVFNCWNDHRSIADLIYYLDSGEGVIDPYLYQQTRVCNIASWVDKCYKHARDFNPANRKLITLIPRMDDYDKILNLSYIFDVAKKIYDKF